MKRLKLIASLEAVTMREPSDEFVCKVRNVLSELEQEVIHDLLSEHKPEHEFDHNFPYWWEEEGDKIRIYSDMNQLILELHDE